MIIGRISFAALIFGAAAFAGRPVNAEPNRVTFPENLDQLVHYTTVKRGNVTEHMLTSREAMAAVKDGKPVPNGRILNPKTARSQVIGAMTMGAGAALMEELAIDKRLGFFVNHDFASYEVPVHADIPHQEVIFLDETDPISSPMKAKGVAELGICGVAAAVANAIYNATGVRVRDYPVTLDKLIGRMPNIG